MSTYITFDISKNKYISIPLLRLLQMSGILCTKECLARKRQLGLAFERSPNCMHKVEFGSQTIHSNNIFTLTVKIYNGRWKRLNKRNLPYAISNHCVEKEIGQADQRRGAATIHTNNVGFFFFRFQFPLLIFILLFLTAKQTTCRPALRFNVTCYNAVLLYWVVLQKRNI